MVEIKDMIAVTEESKGVMGHIFWYTISTDLISPENLEELLEESGLGKWWMPNKIRIVDAFRRATKKVEVKKRKTSHSGVFQNILIREVGADSNLIQRNVVIETVDQNNKKLNYESKSGIIRLDKKTETISFEATDEDIQVLGKQIENNFYLFRDNYSSEQIRALIPKILASLSPTPMKKNGGIYFIPSEKNVGLSSLNTFINSLGNSESYKVPVVASKENKEMVSIKLDDYLTDLIDQCRNTEGLKNGQIKALVEEANQAIEDYKIYRSLVIEQENFFNHKVKTLRNEVLNLLND